MAALLALALLLPGCATGRRDDLAYAPAGFNVQPDPVFSADYEYRLGPSDQVTVTVFQAEDVSGDFTVDGGGNIMVPLIGQVPAQGLTPTQLAAAVRERLSRNFYNNPDVSVSLKEMSSQRVTVDGAVQAPGQYPLQGRTTLMEAVAMARGTNPSANLRRVVVFRQIGGQRMAAGFDLKSIRDAEMQDPVIYPSDIIIVDGSQTRQVLRDVISTIPILALFRPFLY